MIPTSCYNDPLRPFPTVDIEIYKNDVLLDKQLQKAEFQPYWYTLAENKYYKGDNVTVRVKYNWNTQQVGHDYSVVVYSKQDIAIHDAYNRTNMLHFDG